MISLGGVSDKAMNGFLKNQSNIERIVLCLDNDDAGNMACKNLNEKYHTKYEILRHTPMAKDFNEDLMNMNKTINAREPPKDNTSIMEEEFDEEM